MSSLTLEKVTDHIYYDLIKVWDMFSCSANITKSSPNSLQNVIEYERLTAKEVLKNTWS